MGWEGRDKKRWGAVGVDRGKEGEGGCEEEETEMMSSPELGGQEDRNGMWVWA